MFWTFLFIDHHLHFRFSITLKAKYLASISRTADCGTVLAEAAFVHIKLYKIRRSRAAGPGDLNEQGYISPKDGYTCFYSNISFVIHNVRRTYIVLLWHSTTQSVLARARENAAYRRRSES
jgi:hypothetical protein